MTPGDRIAVFDNDGTLWAEQPVYFQFLFAIDVARKKAAADPAWASTPALKAAAAGDIKGVLAGGEAALIEIVSATHSDMTVEDFHGAGRRLDRDGETPRRPAAPIPTWSISRCSSF